jgi:hypothetical protein
MIEKQPWPYTQRWTSIGEAAAKVIDILQIDGEAWASFETGDALDFLPIEEALATRYFSTREAAETWMKDTTDE